MARKVRSLIYTIQNYSIVVELRLIGHPNALEEADRR